MTDTSTIDLNASRCITEQTFIGHQQYTNICSGVVHNVPWGTGDWFGNIALCILIGTLLIVIVGAVLGGIYAIWNDRL